MPSLDHVPASLSLAVAIHRHGLLFGEILFERKVLIVGRVIDATIISLDPRVAHPHPRLTDQERDPAPHRSRARQCRAPR
jgi:hypothetical protein